jgi:hypothetical protein
MRAAHNAIGALLKSVKLPVVLLSAANGNLTCEMCVDFQLKLRVW